MTTPTHYEPPEMTERMAQYGYDKPNGWLEYQIRDCYRELCKSHGVGGARELLNEIADTTEERLK